MTSKRWLAAFFATALLLVLLVAGLNVAVDPFGAFGDRVLQWWSYDETLHPRVAKISYLEQHGDEYDSYVLGASSSSSFSPETLNRYYDGAKFYNMIMYGANMWECEQNCRWLLENCTVKNVVLSVYIGSATGDGPKEDDFTYNLHYQADGSSPLRFYGKYLFANPQNSLQKLLRYVSDPYLQQSYRVFDEATGAYDKSRRDAEPIGSLDEYLSRDAYACFVDYPANQLDTPYLAECMAHIAAMRDLCREAGATFTVVCPPMYYEYLNYYTPEELNAFRNALAQVTDYWDFTLSSLSYDPRFFYDEAHFRNVVGDMALAKMFGDDTIAVPEDFGVYVSGGAAEPLPAVSGTEIPSVRVPVLLYHALTEGERTDYTIPVSVFAEHMAALRDAGYTAVSLEELRDYVLQGAALPEKPVVITFDDGYLSNYTLAYPVLQQYGMKATIFVIGRSVGWDTYVDGRPMTPHFTLEQAREMEDSGLIRIHSHGYNFHQVDGRDPSPIRRDALRLKGESEDDYAAFMAADYAAMTDLIGDGARVIAYPSGAYDELSEVVLSQLGVDITLTTEPKYNTVVRYLPQSLRQLGRISAETFDSAGELLDALAQLEAEP